MIVNQAERVIARSRFGPHMHAHPSTVRNLTRKGGEFGVHKPKRVPKRGETVRFIGEELKKFRAIRKSLATHWSRSKHIDCTPERIHVSSTFP
ncbi:hypothetical protein ACGFT2_30375 [Streptomyces sp. NPDC048514]|uniref:hypothetical protein n=1 Tax=Streptomyces sp. NPDC048514 TaxID=3365564 RepID=UPI00370F8066